MKNIIVITGASSGFGAHAARALAMAGHTVYASMRETTGRNAAQVEAVKQFAKENDVDLRAIELDVASQPTRLLKPSLRKTVVSMSSSTTPGTWSLARRKRSHLNNSFRCTTPTCSVLSASTGVLCPNCASRERVWFFGSEAPAHAGHATIPRTILCCESRYGCTCSQLCRGAQSLGH
jgi:NAD(P)-dependent dehydrogenase (short-subunit alcohol dehydrogenase family)